MKVLLVEDHPIFRFGVRQLVLKQWPQAQVDEAASLAQAIEALRAEPCDLAIVDLNLPDAHGVESVAHIHRAAPATRILVLSLHDEVAYALQVLRLGAHGYLTKEHATEEMIRAITTVAAGGRYITQTMAAHMALQVVDEPEAPPHAQLGRQEYRVMLQLAAGQRVSEIAAGMHLSPKTVSTYRARIFDKLGLASNVELLRYCDKHHLGSGQE